MSQIIQTLRRVNKTLNSQKNMVKMNVEDVQGDNPLYYSDLKIMLGMLDQIIRFYGHDEKKLKEKAGEFIWKLTQFNLPYTTHEKGKPEVCGTFPKDKGWPGISHLIAQAYPREFPTLDSH